MASYIQDFETEHGLQKQTGPQHVGIRERVTGVKGVLSSKRITSGILLPEEYRETRTTFGKIPTQLVSFASPAQPSETFNAAIFDIPLKMNGLAKLLSVLSPAHDDEETFNTVADWRILFDEFDYDYKLARQHEVLGEGWKTFVNHGADFHEILGGSVPRERFSFLPQRRTVSILPVAVWSGEGQLDTTIVTTHLEGDKFAPLRKFMTLNLKNRHREHRETVENVPDTLAGLLMLAYFSPEIVNEWPVKQGMKGRDERQQMEKAQVVVLAKMREHEIRSSRVIGLINSLLETGK